jgi:hypothetical protein
MDEMSITNQGWLGLLTVQSIVEQLAHVAAINGMTPEQLERGGLPMWNVLASKAFGTDTPTMQQAVIAQMRILHVGRGE